MELLERSDLSLDQREDALGFLSFAKAMSGDVKGSFDSLLKLNTSNSSHESIPLLLSYLAQQLNDKLNDQPELIISIATDALALWPSNADYLLLRARAFKLSDEAELAVADYETLKAATSPPYVFSTSLVRLYEELERYRDAERESDTAIANFEPGGLIEQTLLARKQSMGLSTFDEALLESLPERYRDALFTKARVQIELEDFDSALETVDILVETDAKNAEHLFLRAFTLSGAERHQEAVDVYDDLHARLKRDTGETTALSVATVLLSRAAAHRALGDRVSALRDYDEALRSEDNSRRQTMQVQQKLAAAGFYLGTVDGEYDVETRDALSLCLSEPACLPE